MVGALEGSLELVEVVTVTLSSPPSRVLQLLHYLWPPCSPAITTAPARTCTRIRSHPSCISLHACTRNTCHSSSVHVLYGLGFGVGIWAFSPVRRAMSVFSVSLLLTLFYPPS